MKCFNLIGYMVMFFSSFLLATTINVPADIGTIQGGIDLATNGDTVLVQPGTYMENIDFNGKNIVVGSLMLITGDTSYISQTIIDGDIPYRRSVVLFVNGEDSTTVLCGFTIVNGYNVGSGFGVHAGGGILCMGASPILSNIVVKGNMATSGGGICIDNSNTRIINSTICGNGAIPDFYGSGIGGGIFCYNSDLSLRNVAIYGNGAVNGAGGGIFCSSSNLSLVNVLIASNSAVSWGSMPAGEGGGIYCGNSQINLVNVNIINNDASGGASGGLYCESGSSVNMINSIVRDNNPQLIYLEPGVISSITYSDIQSGWTGTGNIDINPHFIDPASGDFHLSDYSLCIGAGTQNGAPATDIDGEPRPNPVLSNPDMGIYENNRANPIYEPNIVVSSDTLNFGNVFIGDSTVIDLSIENNGSLDLFIYSAITQPSQYTVSPSFAGLDPFEKEIFTVTFAPTDTSHCAGLLTLTSNDSDQVIYEVVLNGEGLKPPVISVLPNSINETLLPGQTSNTIMTIANSGYNDLSFDISKDPASGYYALEFFEEYDFVEVPNDSSFDITDEFTIEVWIYPKSYSHWGRIAGKYYGRSWALKWFEDTHYLTWEGNFEGYSFSQDYHFSSELNLNQWYHIAVTFNSSLPSNQIVEYINGTVDAQHTQSGQLDTDDYPLRIGRAGPISSEDPANFIGIIEEVRIWNIARTQSEIQADMCHELTGTETGLVSYWSFNEATNDTAFDKTTNQNHGIVYGGATRVISSAPLQNWLSIPSDSGLCLPDSSLDILVTLDATELDTGDYYSTLIITSNDPISPEITIPVHLLVSTNKIITNRFEDDIPKKFALKQNYPNPFNPITSIEFEIPSLQFVTIKIYNTLGQLVETMVEKKLIPGHYKYTWDASGFASGVFYYRIQAGSFSQTKKLIMIR